MSEPKKPGKKNGPEKSKGRKKKALTIALRMEVYEALVSYCETFEFPPDLSAVIEKSLVVTLTEKGHPPKE